MAGDKITIDLPPPPLNAEQLARRGGNSGANIIRKGRTGEQAIEEFQKKNGNLEESALDRQRKREVGED